MRYELTDHEWAAIKPMLPNKPRGVARVNDRRAWPQSRRARSVVLAPKSDVRYFPSKRPLNDLARLPTVIAPMVAP
jgi:transposase